VVNSSVEEKDIIDFEGGNVVKEEVVLLLIVIVENYKREVEVEQEI